jgi:hypothetical protein
MLFKLQKELERPPFFSVILTQNLSIIHMLFMSKFSGREGACHCGETDTLYIYIILQCVEDFLEGMLGKRKFE